MGQDDNNSTTLCWNLARDTANNVSGSVSEFVFQISFLGLDFSKRARTVWTGRYRQMGSQPQRRTLEEQGLAEWIGEPQRVSGLTVRAVVSRSPW